MSKGNVGAPTDIQKQWKCLETLQRKKFIQTLQLGHWNIKEKILVWEYEIFRWRLKIIFFIHQSFLRLFIKNIGTKFDLQY